MMLKELVLTDSERELLTTVLNRSQHQLVINKMRCVHLWTEEEQEWAIQASIDCDSILTKLKDLG